MRTKMFLGWIAGVIGVISTWISGWSLFEYWVKEQTTLSFIAHTYILFITFVVIIFAAVRQYQTIRKERYANMTPILHMALHATRDLETFIKERKPGRNATETEYEVFLTSARMQVSSIMDRLVQIFSGLTSTNCRACVKLTYEADGDDTLCFYSYARDKSSSQLNRDRDNERVSTNHDPHELNPQFATICDVKNKNTWHFCCNDLLKMVDFSSTSLKAYNPKHDRQWNSGNFWERWTNKKWPLPYKSCLACVIRQATSDEMPDRADEAIGFVSVDSESRGVFEERWDKEIVFAVADSLFRPLNDIISIQRKAEKLGFKR